MVGTEISKYRGIVGTAGMTSEIPDRAGMVGIEISKYRGIVGIVGMTLENTCTEVVW